MLHPRRPLPLLLFVLLAGTSVAAFAQPQQHGRKADPEQAQGRADTARPERAERMPQPVPRQERRRRHEDALSDSIRRIERSTRGQVLSAERVPYDGRNLNRIKVVDADGRVRVYMDDPQQSAPPATPTRGDDD